MQRNVGRNGGTIISVGSDAGKVPTPGETAGAAMAAIVFTRGPAMEAKETELESR